MNKPLHPVNKTQTVKMFISLTKKLFLLISKLVNTQR